MGETLTRKILHSHLIKGKLQVGEFIECRVDLVMANELSAVLAIEEFEKYQLKEIFDANKIAIVFDHFVPNKDVKTATLTQRVRKFVEKHGIKNKFEMKDGGIEHILLPDKGLILPGQIIIGGDSHTITYGAVGALGLGVGSTDIARGFATGEVWLKVPKMMKVVYEGKLNKWVGGKDLILYLLRKIGVNGAVYMGIEFKGSTIQHLSIEDRFTMANMAVECGAKSGVFDVDEETIKYFEVRGKKVSPLKGDETAEYDKVVKIHTENITPQVALPHSPAKVKNVEEVGEIFLDQVVIGSCTNGRLKDLQQAATILKNKKTHPKVRLIVLPGTQEIYLKAIKEGVIETFLHAGAIIGPPTCGPCVGGHMGVIAPYERCLATTNRNFIGRMGSPLGEVYLSSPVVAAASAVAGKIVHPEEVV